MTDGTVRSLQDKDDFELLGHVSTSLVMNGAKIFELQPTFPSASSAQESHRDEKWQTALLRHQSLTRSRQVTDPLKLVTPHPVPVRFPLLHEHQYLTTF
jgi:hypothetical protein